jgi:hypothetical protein
MGEAAAPTVPENGTPPVAPVATPAPVAADLVNLSKEAHDQLVKDAARASEAQSRADRYEGILKKNGLIGGSGHFKPAAPATPPTQEERQAAGAEEDRKAERGIIALALDPAYREVLDKEPLLRDMLTKNPLAILPVLAPDALDADDAVALVKEALNKRKPAPTPPATPPATPPTPPVGGINPQDKPVNEAVEAARKHPNTERAVAGMVAARLKENAGKK